MNQPIEVVELASPYLFWVSMSLITIVTFQSFRQFADGLSFTRAAMYSTLVGNAINVILNFFLIFGFWIFPYTQAVPINKRITIYGTDR